MTDTAAQAVLQSEFKPVSIEVATRDIQMLVACHTSPDQYNQLLLAKLRDAGCTAVEGVLTLRLAHGKLAKMKDDPAQPQDAFVYIWLPDEYVSAIASNWGQA